MGELFDIGMGGEAYFWLGNLVPANKAVGPY